MVDFAKMLRQNQDHSKLRERNRMAATSAQLEILNLMGQYEGAFEQAKVKKNPFGVCKVAPGEYVWHLVKAALTVTIDKKKGNKKIPGVMFMFVCQCATTVDPQTGLGDRTFFGEQFRVNRKIGETKKQTAQESIDRLMYDFQDLGINTDDLVMKGEPQPPKFSLLQLLEYLSNTGFYYRGLMVESEADGQGQTFKNLNKLVRMSNAECAELLGEGNFNPMDEGQGEGEESGAISNTEITSGAPEEVNEDEYNPEGQTEGEETQVDGEATESAEDGATEFVDENGNPCDQYGNPVGTEYDPQTGEPIVYETFAPEPEPEPEPVKPVVVAKTAPKPATTVATKPAATVAKPTATAPTQVAPKPSTAPKAGAPVKRVGPPKR